MTKAILLNPVLSRDAKFGPSVEEVHCFYTPWDVLGRIAGLLPWHPWGWAGVSGLTEGEGRYNYNMSKTVRAGRVLSHLGMFREPALSFYGMQIAKLPLRG